MQLPRTREWREAAGFTQRELSKESGVGKGTIVRIENGESATPRTAKKIADTLNISVADLLESPPVPLGQAPTSYKPPEEAEKSKERREELLGEASLVDGTEERAVAAEATVIKEASRFLSSLAKSNQQSMLEVEARGEYRDILDLADRRAKQFRLFRVAFEEMLQQEELGEVHKENLLALLDDLDSVVDQAYIMAVKSAGGRKADIKEFPKKLPTELRGHVSRRHDEISHQWGSSA